MANKFQSAMPGARLGTDRIIAFLLHHFDLPYAGIILFGAALAALPASSRRFPADAPGWW